MNNRVNKHVKCILDPAEGAPSGPQTLCVDMRGCFAAEKRH